MRTYKILSKEFVPRNGKSVPTLDLDLRNIETGLFRSLRLKGDDAVKHAKVKVGSEWVEEK